LSAEAKKEWSRVVKALFDAGLFTAVDRPALAAYCSAYAMWVKAEEELADGDWILTSPNGYEYQSQWLSIRNRALEQMKSFLTEFGMTPASRSRIAVKPPEPVDALDQLFVNVGKPMMRK
jgi:P27 family predicted phage terminase small subunit